VEVAFWALFNSKRKEKTRSEKERKEMQWSGDGFSGHFLTRKEKRR